MENIFTKFEVSMIFSSALMDPDWTVGKSDIERQTDGRTAILPTEGGPYSGCVMKP